MRISPILWLAGLAVSESACGRASTGVDGAALAAAPAKAVPALGSVVFLHPDGMSVGHWDAVRLEKAGPDGFLAWDRLPHVAIYRSHPRGSLAMTSNAGATIHAYGVKATRDSFGREPDAPLVAASGRPDSIMMEAKSAGLATGLVQTAALTDPGTAVFMAKAISRKEHGSIAAQLIASGVDVLLGGGEKYLLPKGVQGRFGEGGRDDGRNLIEEAKSAGYRVVQSRDELLALGGDGKVLGVFSHGDTFCATSEEEIAAKHLTLYLPGAPSFAEMVDKALAILEASNRRFLLVGEEEGTDNFSNSLNASGLLEAGARADAAVATARGFIETHPDTLLVVGSDSNANGLQIDAMPVMDAASTHPVLAVPERGCPADGIGGEHSEPFTSRADRDGREYAFAIRWATDNDTWGNMVVRGEGMNAHLIRGTLDNTAVYGLMYVTLFGRCLGDVCPEGETR